MPTLCSCSGTAFFTSLDPSRPLAERRDIVERSYRSDAGRGRDDPQEHAKHYVHAYMVVARA